MTGCAALLLAVTFAMLGGCSAYQDAERIYYQDAVKYVEENHEIRREYRARKEALLSQQFAAYQARAITAWESDDEQQAEAYWEKALALLADHYRELATLEAVRGVIDAAIEFKDILGEQQKDP